MLYVDDTLFAADYFDRCNARFSKHPVLASCSGKCFTVRLRDPAFWLALCLYIKAHGGSVFPLSPDTPLAAARRRAELSGSHYLLFGERGEDAVESLEPVAANPHALASFSPSLIQMSSGTTGEPKCIARSWDSIDTEIASYAKHFDVADAMTPVVACPVSHSYGLICGVLVALHRGLAPIVIENFNPKYVLRKLREVHTPILYSSPTLLATITMLAKPDEPIHAVMTSGTLLPRKWFESMRSKVRHVHQQYGCSEAGCIALGQDITAPNELGVPLPHVEILTGIAATDPKEILVHLPGGKIVETRDLGYMSQGRLHFVSRLDDMINVSGLNVYPSEVEEVVLQMPDVRDAVVFKSGHSFGSDQVCLYFVAETLIPHQNVREWCAHHLSAHQVPMSITQVPEIPKLPNGKVSRKALAQSHV
jgi:acyl-coenzyme A synthetase/AMP-(fatty) acid ligase